MESLPYDTLYQIMLLLGVDELRSLCSTKFFYKVCNDDFWKNKFKQDGLVMLHIPNSNRLRLYEASYKATNVINLIINKKVKDIEFIIDTDEFIKIIGDLNIDVPYQELHVRITNINKIILSTVIKNNFVNQDIVVELDKNQLYHILVRLYYYI